MKNRLQLILIVFATLAFVAPGHPASASSDPPSRVARFSFTSGSVSIQPSGEDEWTWARLNRPLTTGDSLWTSKRARAELRIGSTALRTDQRTSVSLLNLDDLSTQVALTTGTVIVRLRSLPRGEIFEINTPNAAITLLRAGEYRIDAVLDENYSLLSVRTGKAEVTGGRTAFLVNAGSQAEMYNTGSRRRLSYDIYALPDEDSFDLWSQERDRKSVRSASLRYVSPELTGYEDLDDYGTWHTNSRYGAVWTPARVSRDWAPYRQGKWSWVEPWGWTWVDDNRWGYVTSHYGRWVSLRETGWAWVPPQRSTDPNKTASYRPVYSPANVAFLGESPSAEGRGRIAWFPLAPGEAYVPPYQSSREYVSRLNTTNTQLRSNEDFDYSRRGQDYYANQSVAGAIISAASALFASSQSIEQGSAQVSTRSMMRARTVAAPPVVPSRASILGIEAKAPATASAKVEAPPAPPKSVETTVVVAKTAPPPRRASFERRKRALEANPGKPLDARTEQSLQVQSPAATAAVELVAAVPATEVKPAEENQPKRQKRDKSRSRRDRQMETTEAPPIQPTVQQSATPTPSTVAEPVSNDAESKTPADMRDEQREKRKAEKIEKEKEAEEKALKAREEEALELSKVIEQQQEQRGLAEKAREERKDQKAAEQQEQKLAAEKAREERERLRKKLRDKEQQAREERNANPKPGPEEQLERLGEQAPVAPTVEAEISSTAVPQKPSKAITSQPVRVEESIQAAKLLSQPKLKYPREARRASVEGTVRLEALIGADGKVKTSKVLTGPEELHNAALENLRQRKYEPTLVEGQPVEVLAEVLVEFKGKD